MIRSEPPKKRPVHPVSMLIKYATDVGDLSPWLEREGIPIEGFEDLDDLFRAAQEEPSRIFLLDQTAIPSDRSLTEVVRQLRDRIGSQPVFCCILGDGDLENRLEAVRAGARACFIRPWLPEEVASTLIGRCLIDQEDPAKILVLHRDPEAIRAVLQALPSQVRGLQDPSALLKTLYDFEPDLLVLAEDLPQVDGLALAAVIRTHEDFFSIPLVLISEDSTEAREREARRTGVDDVVPSARVSSLLPVITEQRIHRMRTLHARPITYGEHCRTGLYNHRYLLQQLEHRLRMPDPQNLTGLVYFEVIPLLPPNEQSSLAAQESFLVEIGHLVRKHLTSTDVAAQVGPREFVLLGQRDQVADFLDLAKRLHRTFSEQVLRFEGTPLRITARFGIVTPSEKAQDAETLLIRARNLCGQAKEATNNPIAIDDLAKQNAEEVAREKRILTLVQNALKKDRFRLLYQPIAATGKQEQEHYDTLLRIQMQEKKVLPPDLFLPVAEKHGLMHLIDRWVLQRSLKVLSERRSHSAPTRLIVRQSMMSIQPNEWLIWLHKQLKGLNLGENKPILEFQLDDVLAHLATANVRFGILQQLGVAICISRYRDHPAARTLMTELPITFIRPDPELLAQTEEANNPQLDLLILHAHNNGIQVIAGCLEGFEAVTRAWQSKADYVVGYFVQPPLEHLDFNFSESRY